MGPQHTQHDPKQLTSPTLTDHVARNTHGQSLDDARETFRSEWQTKVDRKRHQVALALESEQWWRSVPQRILLGGAALGALYGLCFCVGTGALRALPALIVALALAGCGVAIPPAAVAIACALYQQQRAERLEQEARKLEGS